MASSLVASGLGLAVFLFYFAAYPIRHQSFPVGFEPPWYIWRAQYVAGQGIGPVQTSSRPGHAILSAMLGPLTGQSQFELGVILPIALVVLMALAVGALCRSGLGFGRGGWALSIAVSGAVLGATRLLGENVANLLNITFEVAAVVALARLAGGSTPRGVGSRWRTGALWGAVALLVGDGLAHWDFTAIFGLVLGADFVLSLPAARRDRAGGLSVLSTDAGIVASAGVGAGAILAVLIGPVLHAPAVTIGIPLEPSQSLPRLKTDLARGWAPAAAASFGLFRLGPPVALDAGASRRRAFTIRMLVAWTAVLAGGTAFGLLTLKAPAHRFFDLLVAVPGAVAVAATLRWLATRPRSRTTLPPGARAALGAVAVVLLALPAGFRWYRYPGLIHPALLQQAETAGKFLQRLPRGEPVVFLVDGTEGAGSYFSVPLKERTIRMGLPPDRQPDAYIVPGRLADLLADRPTPDPFVEKVTRPYWDAVLPVLGRDPPIVALRDSGPSQYEEAVRMGATPAGQGVAVLRGPVTSAVVPPALPRAVPPTALALLWFMAILALAGAAGAGWTRVAFGPRLPSESYVCVAPVVGAAAMILAGLLVAKAGIRLGGPGGVVTYAAVTAAGFGAALLTQRAEHRGRGSPSASRQPFAEAPPPARPGATT